MLSALLKHLWPLLRDRAGMLLKLARKGFDAIRSFVRHVLGLGAAPKVGAAGKAGASALDRLGARAEAVLRERAERERARTERRAGRPASVDEPSTGAVASSASAVVEEPLEIGAAPEAAARSSSPAAQQPTATATAARSASVLRHPPEWLVALAPLGARVLVNALGGRASGRRLRNGAHARTLA